jgi:small conductance mechanosensitive channel
MESTDGSTIQAQLEALTANSAAITEQAITLTMNYGPKLLLALFTLIIGMWLVNRVVGLARRTMESRKVEPTLGRFLTSLASVGLKALLLISVAGMIGIETTSFIAVLGAAGLAVGLALQGSLANFAGGVLILMFRPFKVGHVVDAGGAVGTVHEIGILNTVLKTFDNKTIIIPNGAVANNQIINMSLEENRRVDWVFGVGYDDDIRKVKDVIQGLLDAEERILKEPATTVALNAFGESSVDFVVRAWVKAPDFWPVYWDMNERVKEAFDAEGISIPFPQRDVHLHQAAPQ